MLHIIIRFGAITVEVAWNGCQAAGIQSKAMPCTAFAYHFQRRRHTWKWELEGNHWSAEREQCDLGKHLRSSL